RGLLDALHDRIAGVGTLPARDALELQALADVDTSGAGHDASSAVDAITMTGRLGLALAARLAAARVVADEQRFGVEQHRLQARVGADDRAHLLAEVRKIEEHEPG